MKLEYLGHSCFVLSNGRVRFLTDPFSGIGYEMPPVAADYVTLSHDHFDHNYTAGVKGCKKVFCEAGEYEAGGVRLRGIPCWHDGVHGGKRGGVVAFEFDFGGVKVCHLGDLGESFSEETAAKFGCPDILLIPVGGNYTIDAREAVRYIRAIRPKIVVPMHYRTEKCALDIAPLSEFIKAFGEDKFVPVTAFDSKDLDAYAGKAVVPEVLLHV